MQSNIKIGILHIYCCQSDRYTYYDIPLNQIPDDVIEKLEYNKSKIFDCIKYNLPKNMDTYEDLLNDHNTIISDFVYNNNFKEHESDKSEYSKCNYAYHVVEC